MLNFLFRRKKIFAVLLSAAFAFLFSSCSGGECSASFTVLEDFDSDCVEDTNDNCLLAENPGASYNPEQFDGDDDGVGVPCDGDDTNDQTTGVFLTANETFNMGGDYEFASGCPGKTFLSLSQERDFIAASDAAADYYGYAAIEAAGSLTAVFSGNGTSCSLTVSPSDGEALLSCFDGMSAEPCTARGQKTVTRLWRDLSAASLDGDSLQSLRDFCTSETSPAEACTAFYERRQE